MSHESDGQDEFPHYFAVLYTENHPWKQQEFLGVFSTEEKAEEAIKHDMDEKRRNMPRARISEWDYQIFEGVIR